MREFSAAYSLSEIPLDENLYQRLRFGDRVVARLGKVGVTKNFGDGGPEGFLGFHVARIVSILEFAGDERIRSYHAHKSRVLAAD